LLRNIVIEKKTEYADLELKTADILNNVTVLADKKELGRMFSNLINNAAEAVNGCHIKGIITIGLKRKNDTAEGIIKDNGKGIPKDVLPRLCRKGASYGKKNGSGLGLWHAEQLCKKLGGSLKIESAEGAGTQIIINLPIVKDDNSAVLIDDDMLVRRSWEVAARRKDINLKSYASYAGFIKESNNCPASAKIYIDSELGEERGEVIAEDLFKKGFKEIWLETGHSASKFAGNKYIKGVLGKEPPF